MTPARRGLVGLLFVLAASCGGGSPPDPGVQPGDLTLQFSETGPTPGAIFLTISGGAISAVTPVTTAHVQVSWFSPSAGTTRIIVTGTISTGDLLTLHVPDITALASYLPAVTQVADNNTFALIDTGPYSLVIHK